MQKMQSFLSVSDAAKSSGYNPDYLTQLCRKNELDCKQISKVWFISFDDLQNFLQKNKKKFKFEPKSNDFVYISKSLSTNLDSFYINGDEFLDTERASELSGYNRDYITQLARKGEIIARKLGKVWFVRKKDFEQKEKSNQKTIISVNRDSKNKKDAFSYESDINNEPIPKIKVSIKKVQEKKKAIHNTIPDKKTIVLAPIKTKPSAKKILPIKQKRSVLNVEIHKKEIISYKNEKDSLTDKKNVGVQANFAYTNYNNTLQIQNLFLKADELLSLSSIQSSEYSSDVLLNLSLIFVMFSVFILVYINLILFGVAPVFLKVISA